MESRQAPHQMLEEKEIKDIICLLVVQSKELRDEVNSKLQEIDEALNKLKRHFCPEKFQEVKVPMSTLSEMMSQGYKDMNLGAPMRISRPPDVEVEYNG